MDKRQISFNFENLKKNKYPGRGIIIGMSPDSRHMVQVYWIMGRSENSRNRVFVEDNGFVRTKAYDESKLVDPSLIIYYPVKHLGGRHIVTNGDQTDTIHDALAKGSGLRALDTRSFEPDAPTLRQDIRYSKPGRLSVCVSTVHIEIRQRHGRFLPKVLL